MRFLSAHVKICQIPHVNFELKDQLLFNFCIILHCPVNFKLMHFQLLTKGCHESPNFETLVKCSGENLPNYACHFWKHKSVFFQSLYQFWVSSNITLLSFLSSNIIYFGQKQPIKVQIFEIFECSCQNLLNSSCQFWTDKSISASNFALIFIALTHNSPVNLKLIHFILWIKGPNKSPNFDTFMILSSSFHFSNHSSLFLQILHHSLGSWNIAPLYFFSSSIIYFGQ